MKARGTLVTVAFLLALGLCSSRPAMAKVEARSFSLSTTRTFAPGESVKIQLYARNVPELEFRVYKVRDTEKFFAGLKDLHSFGEANSSPPEKVDEETWIERLHDFKAHLWWMVRRFFRGQFTDEARDAFREDQARLGKRSTVVGAAQFAQVPLLNSSQLVARWKLETPPSIVSETQQLPIDGLSSGVYLVEATDGTFKAYTVVLVTRIALVERLIGKQTSVYVADRKTGAPIPSAQVVYWANKKLQASTQTGYDGMAMLEPPTSESHSDPDSETVWILAHHGDDDAIVTPWGYYNDARETDLAAYIYTDRPVYRPGHTVHIKAVVRRRVEDSLLLPTDKTLTLRVTAPDGKEITKKDLPVSAHGTVTTDITLETDTALGYYGIALVRDGLDAAGNGDFYVEEYKKPEYQVTVKPAVQRVLQGNTIQATIEAKYFFGEPVAGAKVKYVLHTSTHSWWGEDQDEGEGPDADANAGEAGQEIDDTYGATEEQEKEGILDANGQLSVSIPVAVDGRQEDKDCRIEARVTDAANREVAGHSTVLATYGSFRLTAVPTSYVLQQGQPARVRVTAVDYDGKPVETLVHVAVALEHWDSTIRQRTETLVSGSDSPTEADGSVLVDLPGNLGQNGTGDFQITASAVTPERRTVEGKTWIWIWNGHGEFFDQNQNVQAQIVADKKSYKVGEVAHLLLVTGLPEAWAVVTAEGDSVQWKSVVHATSASYPFDVPITQTAQPNLLINAIIVHDNQVSTAQKSLSVPTVERTLTITATANKPKYLPGEKGIFDVLAVDAQGKPVQADLSFGEVDEALYSVRPDMSGSIVAAFYPRHFLYLNPQSSFEFYFSGRAGLKSPLLASAAMFHPRLAQVKPGSDLVVPKVRKAFPDTAYWNPTVRTGPNGHARVEFNFPDALTTWRTTIRGMTDDGKAGGAVTRVLVRKNLIVRLAAPRFFRQGDEVTLRVIAHNYLESEKDVTFALDVAGLEVLNGQSQKVSIPAKGENFVEWRVKAHVTGNAVLTAKALTNEESDALEMTLPVLPFGVKQRAAGSGVVYSGNGQGTWSYSYPAGSDGGTRSLTITVAPSVAGAVFDALDYLTSYPWGCTEQTMSSFLPDVIVAQAVDKLHLKPPIDRPTLNDMVRAGLERLYTYQHDDGGWGWWPNDDSRVFMTAYVISGMGQAQHAGYAIDEDRLKKGRAWLGAQLEVHPDMIADLRAYAAYALSTTGKAPPATLDKAWNTREKLTDEGLALLGVAMENNGDGRARTAALLLEKMAKTSGADAYWSGNYDELIDEWGDTSSETTAFALKLIE